MTNGYCSQGSCPDLRPARRAGPVRTPLPPASPAGAVPGTAAWAGAVTGVPRSGAFRGSIHHRRG